MSVRPICDGDGECPGCDRISQWLSACMSVLFAKQGLTEAHMSHSILFLHSLKPKDQQAGFELHA